MKTKYSILILFSFIFLFSNCKKDENIVPDFSWEIIEQARDGVTIAFTNKSDFDGNEESFSYEWDFGDNSVGGNTTAKSPDHKFELGGFIEVSLTVTGERSSEVVRKKVTIPGMIADFDAVVRDLNIVTITNKSNNYGGDDTKFYWDMGDGEILTTQDELFEHEYTKAGDYKINLRIERGNERALAAKSITVSDFTVDFAINRTNDDNVIEIEDKTINVFGETASLHIDYGDGTVYDSPYSFIPALIPKTYDRSGNYQITYTIKRGIEQGTSIKTIAISDFLVDFNLVETSMANVYLVSDKSDDLFGEYEIAIDFGDGGTPVTFNNNSYEAYQKEYDHAGNFSINYTITRGAEVGYARKSAYVPNFEAKFNFVQQGSTTNQFILSDASENLFGDVEAIVDFGDGTAPVPFLELPTDYVKNYSNGGTFNITYILKRGYETSTAVKTVTVNNLIADFSITNTAINSITIDDLSSNLIGGEIVSIDFGDGTSVEDLPIETLHQEKSYATGGNYNITYTVDRDGEISTKIKTINVGSLVADFNTVQGSQYVYAITDISQNLIGGETVSIDFGDGEFVDDLLLDGSFQYDKIYDNGGTYNITYTVSRAEGDETSTKIKTIYIGELHADFNITQGTGINIFQISDNSSNTTANDSIRIYFGDNTDTVVYNSPGYPAFDKTFANGGIYNINYEVFQGTENYDNEIKTITLPGLSADFTFIQGADEYTYNFSVIDNRAFGNITYLWDFGNGETSNLHDVTHTFSSGGSHSVTLTLTRGSEYSQRTKNVSIASLFVNFSYVVEDDLKTVTFTDLSQNYSTSGVVSWDFGNGETLTYNIADGWQEVIEYTYSQANNFTVILDYAQDSENKTVTKTVSLPSLNQNIGINVAAGSSEMEKLFNMTNADNIVDATITWDFGDGTTEETYNVPTDHAFNYAMSHEYTSGGSYFVVLTVEQGAETVTKNTMVSVTGLNQNIGINVVAGASEMEKLFNMTNADNIVDATITWDFGDGTTEETYNVPTDHAFDYVVPHTYATEGSYFIELKVEQGAEIVTANEFVEVTVTPPMNPKFTNPEPILIQGETVYFTNTSENIPGTAAMSWNVSPNTATDVTITPDGDNVEVEFLLNQAYTIELEYTDGTEIETSPVTNLTFLPLTATTYTDTYSWNSGTNKANFEFKFDDAKPDDTDGATFAWTLYDNTNTEVETGTDLVFSVTNLPAGDSYYVEVKRTFGSVDKTETKAFTIDAGGVFSWD